MTRKPRRTQPSCSAETPTRNPAGPERGTGDPLAAPRSRSDDWPAALLKDLPGNAVSLVQVGTETEEGDWSPVADALVRSAIDAQQPVVYVQSGGLGDFYDVDDVLHAIKVPSFKLFRDRDLLVRGPSLGLVAQSQLRSSVVDGRPVYACVLPSLDQIAYEVAQHERTHGPALVILAEATLLRPYFKFEMAAHGFGPPPGGLLLSPPQIDAWRSEDLLRFCEDRSAPTVVGWDRDDPHDTGLAAVLDVAQVHVMVGGQDDGHGVSMSLRTRQTLREAWSPTTELISRHLFQAAPGGGA